MPKRITLQTAAWYGDKPLALDFPDTWELETFWPRTPPALTDDEIKTALDNPIGRPTIRELCRGKSRPLIIVDDLNRPTPVARVLPHILRDLQNAGIPAAQIRILVARGSHGAPSSQSLQKKVGIEAASACPVLLHNPRQSTKSIGRTSYGTPVLTNREVLSSDLIVGIGGFYPNNTAGYGGGAKLALGILDLRSISYLHHRHKSVGWASGIEGDFRRDLAEIANMIGLTFSIVVHVDARREIVRLRCGDPNQFHTDEVAFAHEAFCAPDPGPADIVVSNAYPNDLSFTFLWMKGLIPLRSCKPGSSRIAIASCSEGWGFHGVYPVGNSPPLHQTFDWMRRLSVTSYSEITQKLNRRFRRVFASAPGQNAPRKNQEQRIDDTAGNPIWLYCPDAHAAKLPSPFRDMRTSGSWSEILDQVTREQAQSENRRVFIYPCAPLQHFKCVESSEVYRQSSELVAVHE